MAHRDTRHQSVTVKELTRFLAAQFNIHIRIATQISTSCNRNWLFECRWLNGQSEIYVNYVYRIDIVDKDRLYPCTMSDPPDNPCPILFRGGGTTHVHVSRHVGVSEQWLGTRTGGDDIGGPVQPTSPQPAAVKAPPYRPIYGLWLWPDKSIGSDSKPRRPRRQRRLGEVRSKMCNILSVAFWTQSLYYTWITPGLLYYTWITPGI